MTKRSVYVETSIVSYRTARSSRDRIIAAQQTMTREWWRAAPERFVLVASELVLTEAADGDTDAARARLTVLEMVTRLDTTEDAAALTRRFVELGAFPREAAAEASTWEQRDGIRVSRKNPRLGREDGRTDYPATERLGRRGDTGGGDRRRDQHRSARGSGQVWIFATRRRPRRGTVACMKWIAVAAGVVLQLPGSCDVNQAAHKGIHRTVRMSPAMAAGVTETLWTVRDIVGLLEEHEARAAA